MSGASVEQTVKTIMCEAWRGGWLNQWSHPAEIRRMEAEAWILALQLEEESTNEPSASSVGRIADFLADEREPAS